MNNKIANTVPISEARKNIFSIAEEVQNPNVHYTLTERGRPKIVILSAEKFEFLSSQKEDHMILADKSAQGYSFANPKVFSKVMIVRDASRIVYLDQDDRDLKHKEEELVKAHMFVKLIEKYKYPFHLIETGRYVKVGPKESKRYIEADIIINDLSGNVRMIFESSLFADFEENTDKVVADLFDLAYAATWIKKPLYLVYFSISCKGGPCKEKSLTIDYTKFNTFAAWKKAGRPTEKEIPMYG